MTAQVFLIAPANAEPATFAARLQAMLAAHETPVLLVPRAGRSDGDYRALLKAVLPIAQPAGCAVLLDDDVELAKSVGADGVQVTGPMSDVKAAIAALKPDLIVGAGPITSVDDAMTAGEYGVDYVFFGPISGTIDDDTRDMALWWAEAMQVPSVLSDPEATPDTIEAGNCEFVALSANLWQAPQGPDAALAAFNTVLEAQ
jgi:thiamine-phosphate pyrophosphorylase